MSSCGDGGYRGGGGVVSRDSIRGELVFGLYGGSVDGEVGL